MREQYLGPLPEWEYDEFSDQLWEYCNNSYEGVMGFYPGMVPPECLDFCASQYKRFSVPMPSEEVIQAGASAGFWYVDGYDPYLILSGICDVVYTSDWNEYAFELVDSKGNAWEVSMNGIETFAHQPGVDEDTFNEMLAKPGLDAIEFLHGEDLREMLFDNAGYYPSLDLSEESERHLNGLCQNPDGSISAKKYQAYFELAAWAALAWIVGPPGRDYRYSHHEIFGAAISYGECILVEGEVITPERYRRLSRPPKSCFRCGISAWCVDLVVRDGISSSYLCEHCLNAGMPPSQLATCGTKMCHLTKCPYHPYHHLGTAGMHASRRNFGQLGAKRPVNQELNGGNNLKVLT